MVRFLCHGTLIILLTYPKEIAQFGIACADALKLSKDNIGAGKIGWTVSVYPNNCRFDSFWHDNPIDACYEISIRLHEQKLL